jgi:sugar/nucleoside kinase (ribokinase family)
MAGEHRNSPIICIGGANVDRKFYLKEKLMNETSNPVYSSTSAGGVARNIAENLGRLGENVTLITACGADGAWEEIDRKSAPFMDLSHAASFEKETTGSYTAVLDKHGDLSVAFADMDVFDKITPNLLKKNSGLLKRAKCIIADLNCPGETIDFLCAFAAEHQIPLVIIPVSSPKMNRLPQDLHAVKWLIVNKDETETFMNIHLQSESDWKQAAEKWLETGVQHIILTKGARGVMAGGLDKEIQHFPAVETADVADVTGAGDSFCAAVIHTWLQEKDLNTTIQAGLVNAHRTIMSKETVRTDLSSKQLQEEVRRISK